MQYGTFLYGVDLLEEVNMLKHHQLDMLRLNFIAQRHQIIVKRF